MTTREVVAANVRARLAWSRIPQAQLMAHFGWSKRTTHNKLYGFTGLTDDELAGLAKVFELDDPGLLFRVPEGFAATVSGGSVSACTGTGGGWGRSRPRSLRLVAA